MQQTKNKAYKDDQLSDSDKSLEQRSKASDTNRGIEKASPQESTT